MWWIGRSVIDLWWIGRSVIDLGSGFSGADFRERIFGSGYYFSKSDWLRQITWQMGADAWEWMRRQMRESKFKSCDLSEPIRFAKLVSAPASAPENPLPHPLSHHVTCLNQSQLSCIRSHENLTFDSNSTSDRSLSDVLKTLNIKK